MFRALRRLDEFMGRKFGSGTALSLKVRAPWPSAACCTFCRCTMLCVAHGKLHVVHVACSVHQCMPVACRGMAGFFAAARMQHARTMHALLVGLCSAPQPSRPLCRCMGRARLRGCMCHSRCSHSRSVRRVLGGTLGYASVLGSHPALLMESAIGLAFEVQRYHRVLGY